MSLFFFFQAEDGIRDIGVTGVQTCALPIYPVAFLDALADQGSGEAIRGCVELMIGEGATDGYAPTKHVFEHDFGGNFVGIATRSEERRVGKECRSRWSPYH